MSIRVVYFSEKHDALIDVAKEYATRTQRKYGVELIQLAPAKRKKGQDAEAKEAEALLKKSEGCWRIVVDEHGSSFRSLDFSEHLERRLAQGKKIAFLVGGASGLHQRVKDAANQTISLSSFTLPHRMAVLVLVEQIYRAGEIAVGGPYHRE